MSKLLKLSLALILLLSFQKPSSINAEDTILSEFNANLLIPTAEYESVNYLNSRDPHVSYDAPYKILSVQYFKDSEELNDVYIFEKGITYKALLTIQLDSSYKIDSSTVCKINGEVCAFTSDTTIEYKFKAAEDPMSFKVTYSPGETVYYSYTEYKLNSSNFDLSNPNTYIGFKINGVKYDLDFDDYIYLSKDTEIEALFETEKVYVSGTLIDASNSDDVFADGSVSYDFDQNILYLNNAALTTADVKLYNGKSINSAIFATHDLKIQLSGENKIEDEPLANSNTYSIYTFKNLEITSFNEGSLNIINDENVNTIYGILANGTTNIINAKINIQNTADAFNGNYCIYSFNDLYIKDADLDVYSGKCFNDRASGQSFSIKTEKNLEILDSELNVLMAEADDQAAITAKRKITIKGSDITIRNKELVNTKRMMGIYTTSTNTIENSYIDIILNRSADVMVGISGTTINLIELQEGSHIEVIGDSDSAKALSGYFCDIEKGSYTIVGPRINTQPINLTLDICTALYIDDNTDGSTKKMLIDEELYNQKFAQTFIYHDYKHLKHDTDQHWYECDCGEIQNKEHHFDADLNEKCDICGQRLPNYFVVKTGIKD